MPRDDIQGRYTDGLLDDRSRRHSSHNTATIGGAAVLMLVCSEGAETLYSRQD